MNTKTAKSAKITLRSNTIKRQSNLPLFSLAAGIAPSILGSHECGGLCAPQGVSSADRGSGWIERPSVLAERDLPTNLGGKMRKKCGKNNPWRNFTIAKVDKGIACVSCLMAERKYYKLKGKTVPTHISRPGFNRILWGGSGGSAIERGRYE